MSSVMLDPQVVDASSLIPKATAPIYLPIGVEGQMDAAGTATVATLYVINRIDEASANFGPNSSLTRIITALLNRGAAPVIAAASAKAAAPTLVQRQAVWQSFESSADVRLRLTDSETQADLTALGISCKNANLIYNKQIALVGLPSGTSKATLIAGAAAIAADADAATRTVLVGPGVYDSGGTLRGGSYGAASVAAEVAKNADPTNDLDLWVIPQLTGIELDAAGLPVFRRKVVSGTPVNDYEDLLQGGVTPLQPSRVTGGVSTTHLRTVYIVNGTFDALYTRIIVDQVFIDVKNYCLASNFLRAGNTTATRNMMASGVTALLNERTGWIAPIQQGDGSLGYNVSVTPSADMRQVTIGYEGQVVRGISTIKVAANLSIPV